MNTAIHELNERLAALRIEFANRCLAEAARLARIGRDDFGALIGASELKDMREAMHRIAGTSGIFDLPELSRSASAFEEILQNGASDPTVREEARKMANLIHEIFEPQSGADHPGIS